MDRRAKEKISYKKSYEAVICEFAKIGYRLITMIIRVISWQKKTKTSSFTTFQITFGFPKV
jgi:hypothetical protein